MHDPRTAVRLRDKFDLIQEHWSPRIVARLSGMEVKLAKIQGAFVWHSHRDADELFLVIRGAMELQFRDRTVHLAEGDLCVVPRGVEHRPVAAEEAHILLLEPEGTVNTGDAGGDMTVPKPGWI